MWSIMFDGQDLLFQVRNCLFCFKVWWILKGVPQCFLRFPFFQFLASNCIKSFDLWHFLTVFVWCRKFSKIVRIEQCLTKLKWKYRVSHNIVPTFVLVISWPPKHLEDPSWTFFNSPFRVDFKTIQFVFIWWNLDQDMVKILKGSHCKN